MASNVIRVSVLADAKQFEKTFGQATTKAVGFGAAIGTMAGNLAYDLGRRALSAVKDFVGSSIDAFNDLNESLNALEVVYGEHAQGIMALGEASAQSLGVSNAEFNNHAVSISAFAKQIAGEGGDVVGTVDELTKRTADFASVMNIDFSEAAAKFRSGLAGESEPLRRYGIDVSAARIETQALADGIWDGNGAMTEAQKVQARYNAIMEQTALTTGDFANTADEAANKERILQAELENQKALLGGSLLPLHMTWLGIQKEMLPVIGSLATAVGLWTGALERADAALQSAESSQEQNATSLDLAKDAVENLHFAQTVMGEFIRNSWIPDFMAAKTTGEEFKGSVDDLVSSLGLTEDELRELLGTLPDLAKELGLSEEKTDALREAVEKELRAKQEHQRFLDANYIPTMEGVGEATDDTTDAIIRQADEIKAAADPWFRLIRDAKRAEEAQDAYTQAVIEFGEGSPQAQEAALAVAEANLAVKSAAEEAEAAEGDLQAALAGLNLPPGVVAAINAQLSNIRNPNVRLTVSAPTIGYRQLPTGEYVPRVSGRRDYHEGVRRVPGVRGQEVPATLQAGERVLSAAEADRMDKRQGGAGNTYEITVNAGVGDPQAIGRAVVEALQAYERANGAIPINVRVE
jgi:hypothetical protein